MNVPLYCKDTLAIHQAWMQLGFDSANMYVSANDDELLVQLQTKNGNFTVSVSAPNTPKDTILAEWQTAAALYNGLPQEWREANYQRWRSETDVVTMIATMVDKGVYPIEGEP